MPTVIRCPHCQKLLDAGAGGNVECPYCHGGFLAPKAGEKPFEPRAIPEAPPQDVSPRPVIVPEVIADHQRVTARPPFHAQELVLPTYARACLIIITAVIGLAAFVAIGMYLRLVFPDW